MRKWSYRARDTCYSNDGTAGAPRRPAPAPHDLRGTQRKPHGAGRLSGTTAMRFRSDTPRRARRAGHRESSELLAASGAWLPGFRAARRAQHSKVLPWGSFLAPSVPLRPRADDAQMTLSQSGLLTERPRRTREFTARTCPSRCRAWIRTPAGLRASGIRATGAAIQRRLKSWAPPTKQRGQPTHARNAVAAAPSPGRSQQRVLRSPSQGQPFVSPTGRPTNE